MIRLEGVSKVFHTAKSQVRALEDVTLTVAAGEFVALKGRSGSGKSTLLSLIGGLALPTAGRLQVLGQELPKLSAAERALFREQHVGFVFQMFHLLPYLNVVDNVLVAARNNAGVEVRAYAEQLLREFGLDQRLGHRPGQLSAGERQRVAMARALLNRPELLLADEPTGNLDDQNAAALLDLLCAFHERGGTVVLATHDEQAARRGQRVLQLSSGKLASGM